MTRVKLLVAVTSAVLAAEAFAPGARASEWDIEGDTLSELKLSEAAISISGGPVSIQVPSKGITIKCETAGGTGKLQPEGVEILTASLTTCDFGKLKACKTSKPVVMKAKVRMIEAGGLYYYKLEPVEGTALITISETGEECAFGETILVQGSAVAQPTLQTSTKQPLKFSEETSKAANKALKEKAEAELELSMLKLQTFLSGELLTALSGKLEGELWQDALFTQLCKVPPPLGAITCPVGGLWEAPTLIVGKQLTEMHFEMGVIDTTCKSSKFEGETLTNGSVPFESIMTSLQFTECNNKCGVESVPPARAFSFFAGLMGNGGFGFRDPELEFVCGGITCVYGSSFVPFFSFSGGEPATTSSVSSQTLMQKPGSDEVCAANAIWKGVGGTGAIEYKFEAPAKIYLTG